MIIKNHFTAEISQTMSTNTPELPWVIDGLDCQRSMTATQAIHDGSADKLRHLLPGLLYHSTNPQKTQDSLLIHAMGASSAQSNRKRKLEISEYLLRAGADPDADLNGVPVAFIAARRFTYMLDASMPGEGSMETPMRENILLLKKFGADLSRTANGVNLQDHVRYVLRDTLLRGRLTSMFVANLIKMPREIKKPLTSKQTP